MPMQEYENVKGFTFVQSTEPAESKSKEHDTWYNTSNNKVYMFQNYRWKMYVNAIYFPGADYGYICGGGAVGDDFSSIERISFPFDSGTATHVGNLTGSYQQSSACNSSNYGYNCGGMMWSVTSQLSLIERITFPFDSGTATHVGNLSGSKNIAVGCNSSNYGYTMGGRDGSNILSTVDRFSFPFDSGTSTHVGNLSGSKTYNVSCNSSNYGYSLGGFSSGNYLSTVDRITFPFDSGTASHVGNISGSRAFFHTSCNSSNYGYACGGRDDMNTLSIIDRITFPFDSGTATHVGNLSIIGRDCNACNSSNYGYVTSFYDGSNYYSSIDRFSFPFDSGTAIHVGNLSYSRSENVALDGTDFITLFDNMSSRVYV